MGRVHVVRLVWVALLCSCVPEETPIGRTVWSRPDLTGGHVGAGGHYVFSPRLSSFVELVSPEGVTLWNQPQPGDPADGQPAQLDIALGHEGSVVTVAAEPGFELSPVPVVTRFANDGTIAWTRSFTNAPVRYHVNTSIAIDADDGAWLVFDANTPSDVGGGTFGGTTHTLRWGHFAADGSYLASGVFPFAAIDNIEVQTAKDLTALPGGGIAMIVQDRIEAFDANGQPKWTMPPPVQGFVVYDDGSLSVRTDSQTIVRYDAQRIERWRVTGKRILDHTGTRDGGVVFVDSDGLGDAPDISVVTHVSPDGDITRENVITPVLSVLRGPPSDGYVLHCSARGEVDFNDRTIKIPSAANVKRQL